ncbi:hypothetical protein K2173_022743 [Erythroxylum novogranatense]|uniref:Uncharacterized protein n=1 Tax=Erythroxylum novogranatense TaxID=1862640 RepID=A0AAV8SMI3_9ROSI|nr:hypothetical protein K2173_022743 [Erythroxylum novogranatense]
MTFRAEALVPVEVVLYNHRISSYEEERNDEACKAELILLNKDRDRAATRSEAIRQKATKFYNKRVAKTGSWNQAMPRAKILDRSASTSFSQVAKTGSWNQAMPRAKILDRSTSTSLARLPRQDLGTRRCQEPKSWIARPGCQDRILEPGDAKSQNLGSLGLYITQPGCQDRILEPGDAKSQNLGSLGQVAKTGSWNQAMPRAKILDRSASASLGQVLLSRSTMTLSNPTTDRRTSSALVRYLLFEKIIQS